MKKRLILILLLAAICALPVSAKPIDVVVMLDTSESVMPIYEDLVNYIVKNVLTNHVRFGDTFHLINFDSNPELIYSQQLKNSEDLEKVVATLFLLNPLGKHTDLIMALKYLNQYVSSLSDSGNSEVIILTDGIHDPPNGSPFMDIYDTDENTGEKVNLLENELKSITRNGWNVSLVRLPENGKKENDDGTYSYDNNIAGKGENSKNIYIDKSGSVKNDTEDNLTDNSSAVKISDKTEENRSLNNTSTGKAENNIFSFTETSSSRIYQTDFVNGDSKTVNNTATGSPRIIYPEKSGKIKYHFTLPVEIENFYSKPILLKLDRVIFKETDILNEKMSIKIDEKKKKKVSIDLQLPYSVEPGDIDLDIKLVFSDSNRAYPETAVIHAVLKKSVSDFFKDLNLVFKIIFLLIIAGVLIVFFIIFFSSFVHVSVRDSYKVIKKDFEEMVSDKGLRPLALKIIGQNDSRIGTRNIHSFNDKSVKTIGGGHSSYLIFLYKLPSHIAEISHNEGKYILYPKNREFFPDITGEYSEVSMDKTIRIKTENGMIIECYFYEYISPLEKINKIMNLTDHPGMPDSRLSIYSK